MSYFKRSAASAAVLLGALMVSAPAMGAETAESWAGQQEAHADALQQPEQQQALAGLAAQGVDVAAHQIEVGDEELAEQFGGRTWFGTLTDNHYRTAVWGVIGFLGAMAVEEFVPWFQVADNDLPWHLKAVDVLVCNGVPLVAGGLWVGKQIVAGKVDNRELDYLDGLAGFAVGMGLSAFQFGCTWASHELAKNLAVENHDKRRKLLQDRPGLASRFSEYNSWAKWATDQAMIAGNEAAKARDNIEFAVENLGRWGCRLSQECLGYYHRMALLAEMRLSTHKRRVAAMSLSAGRAATEYMHLLNAGADERASLASYARTNFTSSRKLKFQIANDN